MGWERTADTAPAPGTLIPLLDERYSTRVFDPDHVLTLSDLHPLLEAARWSPSAGNSQPWAFIVGFRGDETHRRMVPLLSRGNSFWAPRASAILLGLYQKAAEPGAENPFWPEYAPYDLGQSAAHLTVQAMAQGLGVHQFAGFDHDAAAAEFAVPDHWAVATGIAIGRQAPVSSIQDIEPSLAERESKPRTRKPLDAFVFADTFGNALDLDRAATPA